MFNLKETMIVRITIRTAVTALAAAAALSLSACGDGASDAGDGDETTTSEETAAEGEETPAEGETEPPAEEESSEEPAGETENVFDVGLGDCISSFNAEEQIEELTVIPCEEEHDQEVFAVFEVPEGDGSFPGSEAFQTQVESDCIAEFATFVGMDYNESALDIQWLEPTEESWDQGDRELVCTVYDPAGPVTGTLEGANR